jgi:tetratricopeptide (TPR) repeat protein
MNHQSDKNKIIIIAAILLLFALTAATFQRNVTWRNPLTLWGDSVRKSPGKARIHYNLGTRLALEGKIDDAIEHFQTAIRLRPTSKEYNNLGKAYQDKGLINQAIEQFQLAILLDSTNAEAYYNLGRAYIVSNTGNSEAIAMLTKATMLKSDYTDAYVNLAAAYIKAKRFNDAAQLLRPLIEKNGGRPDAHFNLGVAYYCLGNFGAAGRELNILKSLDSQYAVQLEQFISQPYAKGRQN